ncbi:unnamed protein product [Clonostachys rhizophaga]|uniref:Uncharacterized protein n=1 Tax=Clonostachys rhizophaga TaxID=160324 RepID=A0A9N9V8M2_9HYPO|nr:unnamed protein product [Clonostachys rhizophaga]
MDENSSIVCGNDAKFQSTAVDGVIPGTSLRLLLEALRDDDEQGSAAGAELGVRGAGEADGIPEELTRVNHGKRGLNTVGDKDGFRVELAGAAAEAAAMRQIIG